MSLEAAIPSHLQTVRTVPASTPSNFQPPFPAYSARFPKEAKDLVMAIVGCQHAPPFASRTIDYDRVVDFVEDKANAQRPEYWESASVVDSRGYLNESAICYFRTKANYETWASESGFDVWWDSLEPSSNVGWFQEIFLPSIDRFETVFSDNEVPEGAAHMRESVSGQLREHVYWGSMRDRLAAAQTDQLVGSTGEAPWSKPKDTREHRIRVPGRENLAVIRSGQDWSNTNSDERKLYLDTMHPILTRGMNFLRDEGEEVGCFSCRFMDVTDKASPDLQTDKTFGLAYFDDLAHLESWSKQHKTHLDIFGRFLQYAGELQGNVSLRLFHEVLVLKSDQQFFEYIACHAGTGMLASH